MSKQIFVFFQAAEACGSLEIDIALNAVKQLEEQLEEYRKAGELGELKPFPEDNVSRWRSQFSPCTHVSIRHS